MDHVVRPIVLVVFGFASAILPASHSSRMSLNTNSN